MPTEWKRETYSLSWLRKQAYDHRSIDGAMNFLKTIGVVPMSVRFDGVPKTPYDIPSNAIPAKFLAEFANDWDALGEDSPTFYVDAIACEVTGTPERANVDEVYQEMRNEA